MINSKYTPWAIGGSIGLLVLIAVMQFFSYSAMGNRLEQNIKYQYEQNQNVLTRYTNSVAEQVQIPEMAKNDLKEVMTASLQARYGEGGSDATMQWIKENYPGQVDPQLYREIMQTIKSGRIDFATEQESLLDKKRLYETALGNPWSGFWLRLAGYPRINLEQYKIVTNNHTEEAFASGQEEALKFNVN